ncbi:MAG: hypothetical protein WCK34_07095 [Bacteroidota bacterium]
MNRNKTFAFSLFALALLFLASCAIGPHPNEKIIVGIWKPVKVEKIIDSSAIVSKTAHSSDTAKKAPQPGRESRGGVNSGKIEASIDRFVQTEMRTTMEIFANKTAVKNYPSKPMHATWKMKGKGTRIVAKNLATKSKFVIDIEEISKDRIVIIEHAKVADVKITYERQK